MDYKKYHRDGDYSKFESMFKNIFQKRYGIIHRFSNKPKRVLDVGASTGIMLDLFKEDGCETWGVEPSISAKKSSEKGHKIINTNFEHAKLPENYFDVIVLNHTLEHMDDPVFVLRKAHRLLRVNGVIFVDVPNAGGIAAKILGKHWPYRLPLEHKHQFTKESLQMEFNKSGFNVIHFESRSGIFEYANPQKEFIDSLFSLKKRFLFNLLTLPYAVVATLLSAGDSMSMVGKRVD